MCPYPHSHRHVLLLGKCLGEVSCCTEIGNAMSFVISLNVIMVPNIAATEIPFAFLTRTALKKQFLYSAQNCISGVKLWLQDYILDSYNPMSTLA